MAKRKKKPVKPPIAPPAKAPPRKAQRTAMRPGRGRKAKTEFTPPEEDTLVGLRYAAGKDYSCTFKDVSLRELCARPLYSRMSIHTMENWCVKDSWVEHRRAFREEYRKGLEKAIGTKLVQTRLEYMKRGEKVLDSLFAKLDPAKPSQQLQPTSLEALANATRQFWDKVIEEKEKLSDAIMPEPIAVLQQDQLTPAVKPQLSQQEARAAALTIVRMRRDQIRAAIHEEANEASIPKPGPPTSVIEGEK